MKWTHMSAVRLAAAVNNKEVTARELARAALEHIQAQNPALGAFLAVDEEAAIAQAAAVDACVARGENAGPLAGVPIGIKDNICTRGLPTTCASRMLQGFVPPYDATVVERLAAAGAVTVGKTNMDEFGMGSSGESSAFGPVRNPWDTNRVVGGSSGGSAAAVAVGLVPVALGSDTGGSVRCPAAFCGVVGLKPSYGAVSRFGLVAFASSLEQIGPMARTVEDAELLFRVICGRDVRDATSAEYVHKPVTVDIKGMKVGIPREYFGIKMGEAVRQSVEAALRQLEALGAELREVSLPSTPHALAAYYAISSAEAASNLARYDGIRMGDAALAGNTPDEARAQARSAGFGPEVQRRILLGNFVLSSGRYERYYMRAKQMQAQITREYIQVFETCDILTTPTVSATAFPLEQGKRPVEAYTADVCTMPASLAHLPALSLPCGLDGDGLPVDLQLIGPRFGEGTLLAAGRAYEAAVGGFAHVEVGP